MTAPLVFKGDWIRPHTGRPRSGSGWFVDFTCGLDLGDSVSGLLIILIFGLVILLGYLIVLGIRARSTKTPAASTAVMTPEFISFNEDDTPVDFYHLREIRALRIFQQTGERDLPDSRDSRPVTNSLELILNGGQTRTYEFNIAGISMDAALHNVIQAWRQRIATVEHLRNGTTQAAWA